MSKVFKDFRKAAAEVGNNPIVRLANFALLTGCSGVTAGRVAFLLTAGMDFDVRKWACGAAVGGTVGTVSYLLCLTMK